MVIFLLIKCILISMEIILYWELYITELLYGVSEIMFEIKSII